MSLGADNFLVVLNLLRLFFSAFYILSGLEYSYDIKTFTNRNKNTFLSLFLFARLKPRRQFTSQMHMLFTEAHQNRCRRVKSCSRPDDEFTHFRSQWIIWFNGNQLNPIWVLLNRSHAVCSSWSSATLYVTVNQTSRWSTKNLTLLSWMWSSRHRTCNWVANSVAIDCWARVITHTIHLNFYLIPSLPGITAAGYTAPD